ncbi:type II toxin-antitoxin system VapC family toxin [Candidatus Poribacteria bacterium]
MNGRLAVDTNAVISYRAGVPEVCDLIEESDIILLPVVVLGELLYGAANSARPRENEQIVRKFLAQSVLIPTDENIAAGYANVRLRLKQMGRPIPENDIWVAAACLEFDVALLSQDVHFEYIPDLRVVNWTRDGEIKDNKR